MKGRYMIEKYKTRTELLELIPEEAKMAEIGVFKGEFARDIIKIAQPAELYLVDIWEGTYGSGDKDGNNHEDIQDMSLTYLQLFHQTISKPNIHVVRVSSEKFLQSCEDNYFDCIYIDGDHIIDAVYRDLVNAFSKLKNGGMLMGHDYHYNVGGDVYGAVTRFCNEYNQTVSAIADDGCPSFLINIKK